MLVLMEPPRAVLEHQSILQATGDMVYGNERPLCRHKGSLSLSPVAFLDVFQNNEEQKVVKTKLLFSSFLGVIHVLSPLPATFQSFPSQ
jgi:hypothetical protein